MTLPPRLAGMDRKRLVMYSVLAGVLAILAVLLIALSAGSASRRTLAKAGANEQFSEATQKGGAFAGELLFPGENPYEPGFPFVRERKKRYTFEDIKKLLPDPATIDVDSLRMKRKERLETLYSAVD